MGPNLGAGPDSTAGRWDLQLPWPALLRKPPLARITNSLPASTGPHLWAVLSGWTVWQSHRSLEEHFQKAAAPKFLVPLALAAMESTGWLRLNLAESSVQAP